ncbi:MAG: type II toxin-antitoxin system VapC family toxin [Alphaproteobacteria bacterium]|nr:type II toxin-antitoxin system VapC family toxin [Alphaproteobacteria bacterium]MBL7097549.1 type II toxin-antitoxin system VapC family toxin [Alphaproteobacteria bacterium]
MIILDTNVVSEPSQPRPSLAVLDWFAAQNPTDLYTTSITEAEIFYGLALLPPGKKRDELAKALQRFFDRQFQDRVLQFGSEAAREFGTITAARRKAGRPIKVFDSQIAAIARVHGATVATRDAGDFEHSGISIINPWTDQP